MYYYSETASFLDIEMNERKLVHDSFCEGTKDDVAKMQLRVACDKVVSYSDWYRSTLDAASAGHDICLQYLINICEYKETPLSWIKHSNLKCIMISAIKSGNLKSLKLVYIKFLETISHSFCFHIPEFLTTCIQYDVHRNLQFLLEDFNFSRHYTKDKNIGLIIVQSSLRCKSVKCLRIILRHFVFTHEQINSGFRNQILYSALNGYQQSFSLSFIMNEPSFDLVKELQILQILREFGYNFWDSDEITESSTSCQFSGSINNNVNIPKMVSEVMHNYKTTPLSLLSLARLAFVCKAGRGYMTATMEQIFPNRVPKRIIKYIQFEDLKFHSN